MTELKYIRPEFYHQWLEDCPVKWERIDDNLITQTIRFTLPLEDDSNIKCESNNKSNVTYNEVDYVEQCITEGNDYRDCVDTLVDNMGTNV